MKDFEEYYPQMFVTMLIGLVLLFVVRFIYLIIVNRKILMEYKKRKIYIFGTFLNNCLERGLFT